MSEELEQRSVPVVVLVSAPAGEAGARIARRLVEESLAGCVTRLPGARSLYRWRGVVEEEAGEILLIKTTADRYPALESAIRELHPDQVPEILALPVSAASADWLDWLRESCHPGPGA